MIVKKLTEKDLLQFNNLENELFTTPFSKQSVKEELTNSNRCYLGLFNNESLIAYAGVLINFDSADIIKIGVTKNEQGKGYGKFLLNALINELKQIGVKEILLEVEHQNFKAINLYLGAGFKEISERKNYYGLNSHAKILKLEIKNEN